MDLNKPKSPIDEVIDTAAKVVVERAARQKKIARAQRAKKVDAVIVAVITDAIAISFAAWPLMLGLSGVGISASYWTCVLLVVAARATFGIRVPVRR